MAYYGPSSSLLTTVITSSSTITSYVTVPTGLPPAIVSAIEGLAPCSVSLNLLYLPPNRNGNQILTPYQQDITFTSLADSTCNPADSNCICLQLQNLGVGDQVFRTCGAADSAQFNTFQGKVSTNNIQPVVPGTLSSTPSSSAPVTSSAPPSSYIVVSTSVPVVVPSSSVVPYAPIVPPVNATTPAAGGNTTTSYVAMTTTDAAGNPTTLSSAIVAPAEYTGGAASMKMGALAGALGLLRFVFAGL